MKLHLFEENIAAGQQVALSDTVARALYVTAGGISSGGREYTCDDGFVATGPITLLPGRRAHRCGAGT